MHRFILIVILATSALLGSSHASAAELPPLRLWLKDGSYVDGTLDASAAKGLIGFKSDLFRKPLYFDIRAIRSIAGDVTSNDQLSGHFFLIEGGTRIGGELKDWTDEHVVVESAALGTVRLQRSLLRSIEAAEDGGKRVYSGPRSLDDWTILDRQDNWTFAAGSLTAKSKGARAVGDVSMPEKFRLSLSMSWEGRADFVLSLGCNAPKKAAVPQQNIARRAAASQPANDGAAVRLEMWDAQLAVVREIGNLADIAVLPLDDNMSRFEMTFYVDQIKGLVAVYSPRGRLLEKIQVADDKGKARAFAMLENHGKKVSLDRFDVYSWDGHLPSSTEYPESYVLDKDEKIIRGSIGAFDSDTQQLTLVDAEGETSQLPLSALRRLVIKETDEDKPQSKSKDATTDEAAAATNDTPDKTAAAVQDATADVAGDTKVAEPPTDEPAKDKAAVAVAEADKPKVDAASLIEIEFEDSSRLIGYLTSSADNAFVLRADGIDSDLNTPAEKVVAIIGSEARFAGAELPGTVGTLTAESVDLKGCLADNPNPDGDAVLIWQPAASSVASPLAADASGSIIYPRPNRGQQVRVPRKAPPQQQKTGLGVLIGGIFGGGAAPQPQVAKKAAPGAAAATGKTYEIVFRTGDTVDGVVQQVDERGVQFQSEETSTTIVPHDKMDSLTLNPLLSRVKFDQKKMTRLLTVPRSMKNDPPTHLFVATTGDYLRGRLTGLNAESVFVEVRLEQKEIPRSKISRIIWLHERPWLEEKAEDEKQEPTKVEAEDDVFLVHAVRPDKRGVTFAPKRVIDGKLSGESDLLGQCSVSLDSIGSLLFGTNVGKQALQLRKESWDLALATLPKVYQESADGAPVMGLQSPLVGRAAPGIQLSTIDGDGFDLKNLRGKVVVLDFWASWCGPCIQTMPEVDRIVEEMNDEDIELVAVNLQDSVERAKLAVDRMELKATVIMDVDGEAGRFYDARAIPQTVIVDREGKITHLFVGGGDKFLDQFATALKEVVAGEPAKEEAATDEATSS